MLHSDAPGVLQMCRPSKCSGVVRYCAMSGVENLASSLFIPVSDRMPGSVKIKPKAVRSRRNHTAYACMGILLVASLDPNICAYAASLRRPDAMWAIVVEKVTRVTETVAERLATDARVRLELKVP